MDGAATAGKVPLSFWVVTGLGLVWNTIGVAAYLLTQTRHPVVMASTPPEMVRALDLIPAWATGAWGLAVIFALAGSVLMLMRRKLAVQAFIASLAGLLLLTIYQLTSPMPMNVGQVILIWIIALFLWRFSRSEAGKDLLR